MCRWAAYLGKPIFLEDLVTAPQHSLLVQSRAAEECKTAINADGFGLAWYHERPEPGLYRDVFPAWSDPNLKALCRQVRAHAFLAHVRASTGTAISRNNCHPFALGRWSFMHNGQVGGFERFRKRADMMIDEALYDARKGATDSEALFLIAAGAGLEADPVAAMAFAVGELEALARAEGQGPHMRFAAALTDGERLYAFRYASDDLAPSLYHRWSARRGGWAVVSEPLVDGEQGWIAQESGSVLILEGDSLRQEAFAPFALDDARRIA